MTNLDFRRIFRKVFLPIFLFVLLLSLALNNILVSKQVLFSESSSSFVEPSVLPGRGWSSSRQTTTTTKNHNPNQQRRVQFLWGIESTDDEIGLIRRRLIRKTYLRQFHKYNPSRTTATPQQRICSLDELFQMNGSNDDCTVAYTFVIVSTEQGEEEGGEIQGSNITLQDGIEHNDILYLHTKAGQQERRHTSGSSSLQVHTDFEQSLAWLHYATSNQQLTENLQFDYVAKVYSDVLILPDWFHSMVQDLPGTITASSSSSDTHTSNTATTRNNAVPQENFFAITRTSSLEDSLLCQAHRKFCDEYVGKFYFMTPSVARYFTSNEECPDCIHRLQILHSIDEGEAMKLHLSTLVENTSRLGGGGAPVQIHPLPRLLRKPTPTAWWESWQTYETAVAQWDQLQSTRNISAVHVTGKFARDGAFADEVTFSRTFNMMLSGLPSDRLTSLYKFPDYILQDPRWEKHTEFLTNPASNSSRGGGYWFWKGPLIYQQLVHNSNVKEGDFVIFTDSDLFDHWEWMPNLLDTMIRQNQSLALYQTRFRERVYAKQNVLSHYCGKDIREPGKSPQYSGNFLVFRKSSGTIQLVEDWIEGLANFELISDETDKSNQLGVFRDHRHDQAILSSMLKCKYNETGKTQFNGASTLTDWSLIMFPF